MHITRRRILLQHANFRKVVKKRAYKDHRSM